MANFDSPNVSVTETGRSPELIAKFQTAQKLIKDHGMKMDMINPVLRFSDDLIVLDLRNSGEIYTGSLEKQMAVIFRNGKLVFGQQADGDNRQKTVTKFLAGKDIPPVIE
jgi:hypothetical protein